MKKKVWYLCLSKMPKQRKIKVRILSETSIPKKGEEIRIKGVFKSSEDVRAVRRNLGDKFLVSQWNTMFQADTSNLIIDPHPPGDYIRG